MTLGAARTTRVRTEFADRRGQLNRPVEAVVHEEKGVGLDIVVMLVATTILVIIGGRLYPHVAQ